MDHLLYTYFIPTFVYTHASVNLVITESVIDERRDEEDKVSSQEAAEPTAISDVALPSEPTPDFPLQAQAPSNFSLPHSDNLASTQTQAAGSSDLNLPPSQDFPSPLEQNIAEGPGVGMRDSVLPEGGGALPGHLSRSVGLNSQSTIRSLGSIGLPPVGGGLSISGHAGQSNPLTPLSSFLPNPTSLSSLTSIGGSSSVLSGGLRLPDATSSLSQQSHPPQLPPLPPHLSSFSLMNTFAVSSQLQSSSLGMGGQHTRAQTQPHVAQHLPTITSAPPPSSQHLQQPQHNLQPNMAPAQGLQQTLTTSSNLPAGMPMPLSHNMASSGSLPGSLPNPSALPLLPGMPNMYPYPYTGALPSAATAVQSLPSQPITSAMVRMNTPGFPSQTLVPGYPSYVPPSLYGNTQPPVSNGSFSR